MRKVMAGLVVVAVVIMAAGCASKVQYTPPNTAGEKTNSRVYSGKFEKIWEAAISSIGEDFFIIDNVSKDSKIITLSFSANNPEDYVDCGTTTINTPGHGTYTFNGAKKSVDFMGAMGGPPTLVRRQTTLEGKINIVFVEESAGRTRITVNTRYVVVVNFRDDVRRTDTVTTSFNTGQTGQGLITCVSRNVLEQKILKGIQDRL